MPFYEEGILEQVLLHGPLSIPDLDAYLGQYPARVRRVPDAGEIPVYPAPAREDPLEDDVKAILAVPLEVAGERVGVLSVQGYRAWAFDPTDLAFLELLGQHVSIALENARLRGELEHAALSDPLTGLSNRRAFTARTGRAMTGPCPQGTPLTLVVLDVQQFKRFNDDLGHDVGDAVLIGLARLLQEVTGARGEVFRLGGTSSPCCCAAERRRPWRWRRNCWGGWTPGPGRRECGRSGSTPASPRAGGRRVWTTGCVAPTCGCTGRSGSADCSERGGRWDPGAVPGRSRPERRGPAKRGGRLRDIL